VQPLLDADAIADLRDALRAADYTSTGIANRLGPAATAAVQRNDFRAALRATSSGDALDTLIRLFVCGQTEPLDAVAEALPLAAATELLDADGDGARAAVELEPYGGWWVLADLSAAMRAGLPLRPDHVLGVGGASTTLAAATIRRPVGSALDLGTGCGVQSLHLSTHAGSVTATDLSERALRFAATTAALNGLDWELLRGDLVAPVADRRFDLVVSNPPFVVGPASSGGAATAAQRIPRYTYRDSGRAGDAVSAELVAAAPGLLNPGGTMQFLANWLHVTGEDWEERVAGWLAGCAVEGAGLDAWVIQREVSDPAAYVQLWLADAAVDAGAQPAAAAAWLDWFDAQKATGVGFGIVTLRAGGHDEPTVRIEELRQPVAEPFGVLIEDWFRRQDWLRAHSLEALLGARLRLADDVQLRQEASRESGEWAVDRQVLALTGGARWVEPVDPLTLALVGGCDGTTPLGEVLALLAAAHEIDAGELAAEAVPIVAHLTERGLLLPAEPDWPRLRGSQAHSSPSSERD
jgi:methylase of polypeptide subunit release factors